MIVRLPPFASAVLARIRAAGGRSARMERELYRQSVKLNRMEMMMAENDSAIVARLERLQQEVAAWTTKKGQELAEARAALATAEAAGRAAQKKEDQDAAEADRQAALAKIEQISSGLIEFTPSGN